MSIVLYAKELHCCGCRINFFSAWKSCHFPYLEYDRIHSCGTLDQLYARKWRLFMDSTISPPPFHLITLYMHEAWRSDRLSIFIPSALYKWRAGREGGREGKGRRGEGMCVWACKYAGSTVSWEFAPNGRGPSNAYPTSHLLVYTVVEWQLKYFKWSSCWPGSQHIDHSHVVCLLT